MTTISNAITRFRSEWATRFTDSIVVTNLTDRGTFNETTLLYDAPTAPAVYTGGALIRPGGSAETVRGEANQTSHEFEVYVPWDTDGIEPSMSVAVTSTDGDLNGQTLIVEEVYADSYITRRMLGCRLDQGVGEENP